MREKIPSFPSDFVVGEKLGEGAFGTVYRCHREGAAHQPMAVKMIDKVETPLAEIRKEVEIQARLDHPNIVKVFGVYNERCFVCLVMALCEGRDLVDGLQLMKKTRPKWDTVDLIHCYRPLAAAVHYLHSNKVIHRDLKGDNFMLDRADLSDPQVQICLSDFGSARLMASLGERMKDREVGTKTYWAPELCAGDYGIKVDVWALGVVMYGLLESRLPFRNEEGILKRKPLFPDAVHPVCKDLLEKMLTKAEQERPDIDVVMQHPWLLGMDSSQAALADDLGMTRRMSTDSMPAVIERDAAKDHIAQRRAVLVSRTVQHAAEQVSVEARKSMSYKIKEAQVWVEGDNKFAAGSKMKYEWCDPSRADELGVLAMGQPAQIDVGDAGPDMIKTMLQEHNIDTSMYGRGKAQSLEYMASEVQSGVARLMLDAEAYKKLVRVVDVILLRIHAMSEDGPVLVEASEEPASSDKQDRLPSSSWKPHENPQEASQRILAEVLGMEDCNVELDFFARETFKEEVDSPEFPGLRTVFRKQIVSGVLRESPEKLARLGFAPRSKFRVKDREFTWVDAAAVERKGPTGPTGQESLELASIVNAPLGMNDQVLQDFLTSNSVDVGAFGRGQSKTFDELCEELRMGTARLHADPSGKVRRVCDIVLLHVTDERGRMLIESEQTFPDGSTKALNRLPGEKRRPDENPFITAWQIVSEHLKTDPSLIALQATDVQCFEEEKESVAFPGIATLYRKHLIRGSLLPVGSVGG